MSNIFYVVIFSYMGDLKIDQFVVDTLTLSNDNKLATKLDLLETKTDRQKI